MKNSFRIIITILAATIITISSLFVACGGGESVDTKIAVTSVTLDKSTLALVVGANETLTATVKPDNATNKKVTWTSSNTAVATVSTAGKVTAVSAGSATVTVTTEDGSKTASCAVTVTPATVTVTSVTLDKSTLALAVGANETLTATVKPDNATNKKVTWTSSNTAVATVSTAGKVTAVSAGSATITVTTEDGSKTASCAVTVTPATVTVTSVTLDKSTLALAVGANETLTATVKPDNATNKKVTWTSSNTAVATVSTAGKVTAVSAGSATITVTTEDGKKTATCSVVVNTAITSVTLSRPNKFALCSDYEGYKEKLVVTVLPANASEGGVTWTSSAPTKVSVDQNGNIEVKSGLPAGANKVTITATSKVDASKSHSITIDARRTYITSVRGDGSSDDFTNTLQLVKGSERLLHLMKDGSSAAIEPIDAAYKIRWTSSDTNVADFTENANGTSVLTFLKCKKLGTTTISATTPGTNVTKSFSLTVVDTPITKVTVTRPNLQYTGGFYDYGGYSEVLTCSVEPSGASNPDVVWRSSNPTKVSIEEIELTGPVMTILQGVTGNETVTITATSVATPSVSGSITVKPSPVTVTGMPATTPNKGDIFTLTASYKRANDMTRPTTLPTTCVQWTSSDTSVATIEQTTGKVTCVSGGTTTITANVYGYKTTANLKVNYSVGDVYPSKNNSPQGVVFYVSADKASGKIIHKSESEAMYWGTSAVQNVKIGATSNSDGAGNTAKIVTAAAGTLSNYLATKWCKVFGDEWYLPAKDEVVSIVNNATAINTGLAAISGTAVGTPRNYWTSTENANYMYVYLVSSTNNNMSAKKYNWPDYVRAAKAVTF